jgi:hypothetical protein
MPFWNMSKNGIHSCSNTWEAIRCKLLRVNWCQLIWFPMAIPRPAFIFGLL